MDRLRKLFGDGDTGDAGPEPDSFHLAAATLLVWAGSVDGTLHELERRRIAWLFRHRFNLEAGEAEALMTAAEREAGQSVEIHRFTRTVKDGFTYDERVNLMEMLWDVVCADDIIDDHEAQLMRRVAGLLYVNDRDSAIARSRVLGPDRENDK